MTEYSIKYNGSGVRDETAYRAICHMAKPGEIWTARDGQEYVLILCNQGTLCNCLQLVDMPRDNNCVEVVTRGFTKYTNPALVKYVFNQYLQYRVDRITEADLRDMKREVAVQLGIVEYIPRQDGARKINVQKCHELLDEILKVVAQDEA